MCNVQSINSNTFNKGDVHQNIYIKKKNENFIPCERAKVQPEQITVTNISGRGRGRKFSCISMINGFLLSHLTDIYRTSTVLLIANKGFETNRLALLYSTPLPHPTPAQNLQIIQVLYLETYSYNNNICNRWDKFPLISMIVFKIN